MKKMGILLVVLATFLITGCEKVDTKTEKKGNYKEGSYFATVIDNYGGKSTVVTAFVYVGEDGYIKAISLDTSYPYTNADGTTTYATKKALKDDYDMRKASPIKKEWYEQIDELEKSIVKNQGLEFIQWKDSEKTTTDSVAGVTLKINALYEAAEKALKEAK
jgi:FMN-binding domain.